jgi:hypothetical protein
MNAYQGFNAQISQQFAALKELDGPHVIPNPSLAANGFNVWWQKTAAQNMAMVTEASALMHAHRRVNSTGQARVGPAH